MNRIRLLPEHVANQIAAGEVVERPASVVKELVENALDAQATQIKIEIQAGGRSLIRVSDNGLGMNRDDALLCLERHATSKIRVAEDLAAIQSMGFRGEALPSIASVSRMTLTTREADSVAGTQIVIHGGRIIEVKEAGCAPGTSIEVRQLFFNLPARRKFLRSEETERAHIQHYVTLAALAFPEVAVTFLSDQRLVWQLPGVPIRPPSQLDGLRERLRALHGTDLKLLAVDSAREITTNTPSVDETVEGEETLTAGIRSSCAAGNSNSNAIRIWGFIGAPGVSRATREEQHLFVNRRPVENRGLNFALLEGYHTALMKGRYPVCCLFLEISPAEVDVNIHPAKREVKFHHESAVRHFVAQAIRSTLEKFHSASAPSAASQKPAFQLEPAKPAPPSPNQAAFPSLFRGAPAPSASQHAPVIQRPPSPWNAPRPMPAPPLASASPSPSPSPTTIPEAIAGSSSGASSALPTPSSAATGRPASEPVPLLHVPLRLVGVIGKLYVVLESDRGLVLLDQHAAHERILFEQMLRRLEESGQAPSQRLLLAETIELSPRDAQFLREQLETLARLGVGLSEFGERTFLLDSLPPFVKVSDARQFALELVDELKAGGDGLNACRLGEHTVAKTVCRHAVKANDPLSGPELEKLVDDLRHCRMPYTCPHGRPTLIEMNFRELEKKFGRSQ